LGCELHKNAFGAGLRLDPLGKLYSILPDPLAVIRGREKREGKGYDRKGMEEKNVRGKRGKRRSRGEGRDEKGRESKGERGSGRGDGKERGGRARLDICPADPLPYPQVPSYATALDLPPL